MARTKKPVRLRAPTRGERNTLRKKLGGPCKIPWKEGVRRALEARYPGAVKS